MFNFHCINRQTLFLIFAALLFIALPKLAQMQESDDNVNIEGVNQWTTNGPNAGNVEFYSLAMDPGNAQVVYAAAFGGVYKTTNGGQSWGAVNNGLPASLNFFALAIDPTNSQVLYAGGYGVYKTTNGGKSWSASNNGLTDARGFIVDIYSLAIDPTNSQILYAGNDKGVVYKTINGGQSWSAFSSGFPNNCTIDALAIDRTNTQVIYAGADLGGGRVYKTMDGGRTWNTIGDIPPGASIYSLAIDPKNSQVIYAAIGGGTYKTTNGGQNWSQLSLPAHAITIDPSNPQVIYAGSNNGVYKSSDGGQSWSTFSNGIPSNTFIDSLSIDPTGKFLHAGTIGNGVYDYQYLSCTYNVTLSSQSFTAFGGSGTANVTTSSGCSWTSASDNTSILGITSGGGNQTGSGSITFSVAPNSSASPRSAILTIAGQQFNITQAGAQQPTVSITAPANGQQFTVGQTVNVQATASVSSGAIARVDFYTNGVIQSTRTAAPYTYSFTPTAAGNYTLQVTAVTDLNQSASATVTINVVQSPTYTISGRVVDAAGGNGLKNILVTLSGTQAASTRTDASGNYVFSNIAGGGAYLITPVDASLIFAPLSQSLLNLSANQVVNFTASVAPSPTPTPDQSDDFSGSGRDPNRWMQGSLTQTVNPNVSVTQQNGQLVISLSSNQVGFNGYVSTRAFNFTNGQASLEVDKVPNLPASSLFAIGSGADNYYLFMTGNPNASPIVAEMFAEANMQVDPLDTTVYLIFRVKQDKDVATYAVAYNRDAQKFWRFRNDQTVTNNYPNGAIVFETSPGPGPQPLDATYTVQFRAAIRKPIDQMQTEISAGTTTPLDNPGQATFDNYQLTINNIDDASFFVGQHYRDFLNRQPDSAGLVFWTDQIVSCNGDINQENCIDIKRQNVSAAYFLSREFQETGFFVIKMQRVAFGKLSSDATKRITYQQFFRDAQGVGQGFIVGQNGADQKLEQNKTAYAQSIVISSAFISKYPTSMTAAQFVDALFATAGVSPQGTERQDAINAFGSGGTAGRAAALRKVAESDSVKQAELNGAFVLLQYFGYLRRNPTDPPDNSDDGYQFWLKKLNEANGDYIGSQMVRSFIVSPEYRMRFGKP